MVKEFFKRIVAEVIKELIAPELQALRAEIGALRQEVHAEIGALREEMRAEISDLRQEIRHIHARLDTLYNVVVRREEHASLQEEIKKLRDDVERLKRKVGV